MNMIRGMALMKITFLEFQKLILAMLRKIQTLKHAVGLLNLILLQDQTVQIQSLKAGQGKWIVAK